MDFSGSFWAANSFLRDVVNAERRRPQYPVLEMEGGK